MNYIPCQWSYLARATAQVGALRLVADVKFKLSKIVREMQPNLKIDQPKQIIYKWTDDHDSIRDF